MTDLLVTFANPEAMHTLSVNDKLLAGLITTLLGMGITFTALIILQFIISALDRILNKSKAEKKQAPIATVAAPAPEPKRKQEDPEELVAVISTVLAMQLGTRPDRIVIRDIVPIIDDSPAWNRAGIIEQMNSRF